MNSILNPKFRYVNSDNTDIRKLFKKVRKAAAEKEKAGAAERESVVARRKLGAGK